MAAEAGALSVVTDSARDLLQSAAFFSNEKLVAWEYISNGLQYVDTGTSPRVDVVVDTKQKRMIVTQQGRRRGRERPPVRVQRTADPLPAHVPPVICRGG